MFYLVAPVAAGLAAVVALILFARGRHSPELVRGPREQLLRAGGFVLLLLGVAAFVAAGSTSGERHWLGWVAVPFAALLIADGLLATVRIRLAGDLLVICGVVAPPLTAVLMLLTNLFDPAGFERSQALPLAVAVGLFTVPAMLTGGMFAGAGKPPLGTPLVLSARLGATPR
jgi:hypothetical protein